jgi:hypothetical protein
MFISTAKLIFIIFFCNFCAFEDVFSNTMVDLKSCNMANSVPNSSLTYNIINVGEPVVV